MMNKIVFLFGAGISKKAGLPLSKDLTKIVLSGNNIYRHTDLNYYFGKKTKSNSDIPYENMVIESVDILNKYLLDKLKEIDKTPNYEDIYQLVYTLKKNYNKSLKPLFDIFDKRIIHLLVSQKDNYPPKELELGGLIEEVCNYISCIVWHKLQIRSEKINISYLNQIVDFCKDSYYDEIFIFTLNHDLVLEELFKKNNIDFTNGFEKTNEKKSNVRYWDSKLFENDCKVKLFKLHGSINWFEFLSESKSLRSDRLGIPLEWDYWHTRDEEGNYQWPKNGKPLFLTGTKNKIFDYENNEYIKIIIDKFKDNISTVNTIITSGYGFGDEGINEIINVWINNDKRRKIININKPYPDVSFKDKIITVGKYIQDTVYKDIKRVLEEK